MLHYFCEDELSDGLISAGLASGALKPWRRDGEGRQWFEQVNPSGLPMIHGVPKSRDVIEADDELDDIAQLDNARALRVYSKLVDVLRWVATSTTNWEMQFSPRAARRWTIFATTFLRSCNCLTRREC